MIKQDVLPYQSIIDGTVDGYEFEALQKSMKSVGFDFIVDPSVVDMIKDGNQFEVWTSALNFVAASKKFYHSVSYSYETLRDNFWGDLFNRDELMTGMIIRAVDKSLSTQKTVMEVTPWHLVTEKQFPGKRPLSIKVEAITPFWATASSTRVDGFIAVTKMREVTDN